MAKDRRRAGGRPGTSPRAGDLSRAVVDVLAGTPPRGHRGQHRHVPQHRKEEHWAAARTAAVGAAGVIAVGAALGLTVGGLGQGPPVPLQQTGLDAALDERGERPARGMNRATVSQPQRVAVPRAAAPEPRTQPAGPPPAPLPPVPADCEEYSGNRQIGCSLLSEFGFGLDQMPALEALWTRESGWNHLASNPSSGAYGIPQALPGNKMASAGSDWETNPATQIRWGLGYIRDRYGNPDGAWAFFQSNGWY